MATFLQRIGKAIDTTGRKLGNPLPELGISERLVGKARAQGPATLGVAQRAPIGPTRPSGVGGSYPIAGGYQGPVSGGGGGGVAAPMSGLDYSSVMEEAPSSPGIDFDALIAPALEGLEATIAPLEQQSAANIQGYETQRTNDIARTQAEIGGQEKVLEGARTRQSTNAESAANEARRQYAEIQQGLQARYGGTTGTGAFATEIAGTQALKNIGNIRTSLSEAMLQIDDKLQQVKEIGRIAVQDIEDNTRTQVAKEKANLESALADIRRQKGELQSRKAELAAQAIQLYQSTVAQVNARNAAFKQQLFVQQQDAENKLKAALQKAGLTAKSFSVQDLTSMAKQFTPVGLGVDFSGKVGDGGRILNPTFSAKTLSKEDDDYNPFEE